MSEKSIKELKGQVGILQGQRVAINKKEQRLNAQIHRIDIEPKLKAMVGRCFKYRNSYGSNQKDWWLYVKVIGYNQQYQQLATCTYQRTSLQRIEIVTEEIRYTTNPLDDHLFQIPISPKQFNTILSRAIKELEKMKEQPK